MRLLSIDTGNSGALAWFEDGELIDIFNMPTKKIIMSSKKEATVLDFKALGELFHNTAPNKVVIEKVHSMPKQGVASTFKFGVNFGALQALAEVYSDDWYLVTPQKWKKHFALIGMDKIDGTKLAREYTKLATNSGKADAYLIGKHWLYEKNKEEYLWLTKN